MKKITLYPHQIKAVEVLVPILQIHRAALDASDTGTGKTITALSVAAKLGGPFAIVCPKAVLPNWKRWAKTLGLKPEFILNYEKLRGGKTEWFKVTKSGMIWELPKDTLLIWDEVHKCKGVTSINSKMLIAAKHSGMLNLMLSATAASSPLDLKALGYLLGLHRNHDYWSWAFRHGVRRNPWNGYCFKGGPPDLKLIADAIFPGKGFRTRISELGDIFPDNQIIAQPFHVPDITTLNRLYREAAEAIKSVREKKAEDKTSALTAVLRARQESELQKVPTMVEMTQDLLDEGNQVALFLNFSQSIETIKSLLDKKVSLIQGGQTEEERGESIDKFQIGEHKVILCNIQAGGLGVSLHDEFGLAPRVSLISPTFSAINLKQTLGRIHRAGAKSRCRHIVMFAADTIEERVCDAVKEKLLNLDSINDNDTDPTSWLAD